MNPIQKLFRYLLENKIELREIIEGCETKKGKRFDLVLLVAIIASVSIVMLDSDKTLNESYGLLFYILEWMFTILFTIEYFLRIYIAKNKRKYIFSFMGIVDLLSIIPTYIGFAQLADIRLIRLIRIFKILQLSTYTVAGKQMLAALRRARPGLTLFSFFMVLVVVIMGTIMYLVEGPLAAQTPGFETIPKSIYWTIVTMTTVGYGNVVPVSVLGKLLASSIMIIAFTTIAVGASIIMNLFTQAEYEKDRKNVMSESFNDLLKEKKELAESIDNLRVKNRKLKEQLTELEIYIDQKNSEIQEEEGNKDKEGF